MIGIVNYGMGNTGSILNMLKKIGVEAIITNEKQELEQVDKIILPGVGTFDQGMYHLQSLNLVEFLRDLALNKQIPFLGICLGMQLMGRKSEEGHLPVKGLQLIPFDNIKFDFSLDTNLKVPHMGWDVVELTQSDPLLAGIESTQRYYFVHSYHAVCDNYKNVLMSCDYGYKFVAAVKKENVYGVQFHPEKSHKFGLKLLENFARNL